MQLLYGHYTIGPQYRCHTAIINFYAAIMNCESPIIKSLLSIMKWCGVMGDIESVGGLIIASNLELCGIMSWLVNRLYEIVKILELLE